MIAPRYNTPQEYLKDIQQDIVLNVSTIHDEVNLGVEDFLREPLLKKIIDRYTAKDVIDKFKHEYMNFLYDSEFNTKTGAFSGEGYKGVEGFSPYTYPLHKKEHKAKEEFEKTIESLVGKEVEDKPTQEILTLNKEDLKGVKLKKYHKKGGIVLRVKDGGDLLEYKHRVDEKKLKAKCRGKS